MSKHPKGSEKDKFALSELKLRIGGQLKGKVWMSQDFDAPDPEVERLFYEGDRLIAYEAAWHGYN